MPASATAEISGWRRRLFFCPKR